MLLRDSEMLRGVARCCKIVGDPVRYCEVLQGVAEGQCDVARCCEVLQGVARMIIRSSDFDVDDHQILGFRHGWMAIRSSDLDMDG